MANMSYCRFENTLRDLQDCYDALNDPEDQLSPDEESAKTRLIKLCADISEEFSEDDS